MMDAFIYLAAGAVIVGVLVGPETENPVGYAVSVAMWPFIAISIAASMIADAFRGGN